MSLDSSIDAVSCRLRCPQITEYPFYTKAVFGELDVSDSQTDHPLCRLIQFLKRYESSKLFTKHDPITKGMRRALGWRQPGSSNLSPEDAAKLLSIDSAAIIKKDSWDQLSSLFTAYRLMDVFVAYDILPEPSSSMHGVWKISLNEQRQRNLTEEAVKNIKGWDKLKRWPNMLKHARVTVEKLQSTFQDTPTFYSSDFPHLNHLASLSRRNTNQKYNYILDNFQVAAMHLYYMLTMPGKALDGILPDIPEQLEDLFEIAYNSTDNLRLVSDGETTSFLEGVTPLQLRLPLHFALAITPLCLLHVFPVHKATCDRSSLLRVTGALGNFRPSELRGVEKDILSTVVHVAFKPTDLKAELTKLFSSESWKNLEDLPSSDPAYHFFDPSHSMISSQPSTGSQDESALSLTPGTATLLSNGDDQPTMTQPTMTGETIQPADSRMSQVSDGSNQGVALHLFRATDSNGQPSTSHRIDRSVQNDIFQEEDVDMPPVDPSNNKNEDILQVADKTLSVNMLVDDDEATPNVTNPSLPPMSNNNGVNLGKTSNNVSVNMHVDADEARSSVPTSIPQASTPKSSLNPLPDAPTFLRRSTRNQTKHLNESNEAQGGKANDSTYHRTSAETKSNNRKGPKAKRQNNRPPARDQEGNSQPPAVARTELQEVIDVDDLWTRKSVTLNVTDQPERELGTEICAYGPRGEISRFCPIAHNKTTIGTLQAMWNQVENAYEDEKPLHISNPQFSGFKVLSHDEASHMQPHDWMSILNMQCVVVTGGEKQDWSFKSALQDLGALTTVMTIQDQSIPVDNDYNVRCMNGTFAQLVEASQYPKGKILNALDIGVPFWGLKEKPYASNVSALMAMRGELKTTKSIPMEEVNWALAATAGAFHTWHIDCNGFMTFVSPVYGEKLWIIARPRVYLDFTDFANITLYLDGFNLDKANEELWTLEAILLKPGDTLIMRPNTPHSVYTPVPSVVHGGHCYSSSTLQDSLVGIVHAFMTGHLTSNANHLSARFHLQQMIAFYHLALVEGGLDEDDKRWAHVPDCCFGTDFTNLMAICMFGILINVLDFATYQYPGNTVRIPDDSQQEQMIKEDINGLSEEERKCCTHTRGQALQIMDIIAQNYNLDHPNDFSKWQNVRGYQEDMILRQCQMLLNYKSRSTTKSEDLGATGCDMVLFTEQLSGVLDGEMNAKIKSHLKVTSELEPGGMLLPPICLGLAELENTGAGVFVQSDPMILGVSVRDRIYYESRRIKAETQDESFDFHRRRKRPKF